MSPAVFLTAGLLTLQASWVQDTLSVVPQVDPAVVTVGRPFTARIAVPRPDTSWTLVGPPAPAEAGPLDLRVSESADHGDSAVWVFEGAWFDVGEMFFPPLPLIFTNDADTMLVLTRPYQISVESSLPADSTEWALHDIRGPIDPGTQIRWSRVALAAGLLGLLAGTYLLWRRRRPGEVDRAPIPAEPPHILAMRSLKQLEEQALPARGKVKEHFVELSRILRVYLQGRYGIPAVESTTDEIQVHLHRDAGPGREHQEDLIALLSEADLVKFAKFKPPEDAGGKALTRGVHWVEATASPRPEEDSDAV